MENLNKFFKNVYYSSLGIGSLFELYEALYEINNFRHKFQEGSALDTPEQEQTRFEKLLDNAEKAITNLVDRVSVQNDSIMQQRFQAVEDLVIDVIEQQYKMKSDSKSEDYGTIINDCGTALRNLIEHTLRDAFLNSPVTPLYHTNGEEARIDDFTIGFFMELAKKEKGINFHTLLIA